jgi:hypothetical protein
MAQADGIFDTLVHEPVFLLTADQDWAPDWALEALLDVAEAEGVPLHLFVTNASPLLERRRSALLTLGIHPNFQRGSTHGATEDEVIEHCLALVPGATSFRAHGFHENTRILSKLAGAGAVADSNLLAFLQPGLTPIVHAAGLLRFPVFFEDDVFLALAQPALELTRAEPLLLARGLKILNFHPSLVALNACTLAHYDDLRDVIFGAAAAGRPEPYAGRGAATLLHELIGTVKAAGLRFASFPALVDDAYASLRRSFPDGLYGWPALGAGAWAGRAPFSADE